MAKKVFVHEKGLCESLNVGAGTRIWAFVHVLPGAIVGRDCNICDHVFVENDVIIGDRVTIKSGVQLWDGARIGDDVFIGPNATFTNDKWPRSKQYPESFAQTVVETGASIGANATLLPGIRIGSRAMIGAGAVVVDSVPPKAIAAGNPARIIGYVASESAVDDNTTAVAPEQKWATGLVTRLTVGDCELWHLPSFCDLRGDLLAIESHKDLPFVPVRVFFVYGVASEKIRGQHAHLICDQFLVAVRGALSVVVDDGERTAEVRLDKPNIGLHLPRMVWGTQYKFTRDAVLAVFASRPYEAEDYIREYDTFLERVRARQAG